ncbi:MAG: hypothetical protein WDN06_07950 [Asticcacaulis sp.]
MRLYTADYAPNPRRVRWIINEKGIADIEIVPLDIMKLEHRDHPAVIGSDGTSLPELELDDGERDRRVAGHRALSRKPLPGTQPVRS